MRFEFQIRCLYVRVEFFPKRHSAERIRYTPPRNMSRLRRRLMRGIEARLRAPETAT